MLERLHQKVIIALAAKISLHNKRELQAAVFDRGCQMLLASVDSARRAKVLLPRKCAG